ncbi:hypothetical protein BACCAP_01155 [Pseudoflavonifractor capillosus ATCC 29799]|uniref:Uncharacterized protein n=1 Tax=Pseudoflavonifractor capillosus ATCC 29799 TaxID=411467 RepID=A6NSH6_9FIRM|nr:hypothetical protein BACCAP_01155 [Pseudoflavonifractor capillosus ATCC 29799]
MKASHWGNLRRQDMDAGESSISVSQKTYKGKICCLLGSG